MHTSPWGWWEPAQEECRTKGHQTTGPMDTHRLFQQHVSACPSRPLTQSSIRPSTTGPPATSLTSLVFTDHRCPPPGSGHPNFPPVFSLRDSRLSLSPSGVNLSISATNNASQLMSSHSTDITSDSDKSHWSFTAHHTVGSRTPATKLHFSPPPVTVSGLSSLTDSLSQTAFEKKEEQPGFFTIKLHGFFTIQLHGFSQLPLTAGASYTTNSISAPTRSIFP